MFGAFLAFNNIFINTDLIKRHKENLLSLTFPIKREEREREEGDRLGASLGCKFFLQKIL
jgi:hypothetical protein